MNPADVTVTRPKNSGSSREKNAAAYGLRQTFPWQTKSTDEGTTLLMRAAAAR
jgi:hypothetical protein